MEAPSRRFSSFVCIAVVIFHIVLVRANVLDDPTTSREVMRNWLQSDCAKNSNRKMLTGQDQGDKIFTSAAGVNHQDDKAIDITATYTDPYGVVRTSTVKSKDLSASWYWENPVNERQDQLKSFHVHDLFISRLCFSVKGRKLILSCPDATLND